MSEAKIPASRLVSSLRDTASLLNSPDVEPGTTMVHLLIEAASRIQGIPGECTSEALNRAARRIGEGAAPDNAELSVLLTSAAHLIEADQRGAFGRSEPAGPVVVVESPAGIALACRSVASDLVHGVPWKPDTVANLLVKAADTIQSDRSGEPAATRDSLMDELARVAITMDSGCPITWTHRHQASHLLRLARDTIATYRAAVTEYLGVAESIEAAADLDDIGEFLRAMARDERRAGSRMTEARLVAAANHIETLEREVRVLQDAAIRPTEMPFEPPHYVIQALQALRQSMASTPGIMFERLGDAIDWLRHLHGRCLAAEMGQKQPESSDFREVGEPDISMETCVGYLLSLASAYPPDSGFDHRHLNASAAWILRRIELDQAAHNLRRGKLSMDFDVDEPALGFAVDGPAATREPGPSPHIILADEVDAWPTEAPHVFENGVRRHITHPDRTDIPPRTVTIQDRDGVHTTLEGWIVSATGGAAAHLDALPAGEDMTPTPHLLAVLEHWANVNDATGDWAMGREMRHVAAELNRVRNVCLAGVESATQMGAGFVPCGEARHIISNERSLSMCDVKVTRQDGGRLLLRVGDAHDFAQVSLSTNEAHTIGAYMLEPGDERAHVRQVREVQMGGKWDEMAEALYPGLIQHEHQRAVIAGGLESINANLVNRSHFMLVVCPSPEEKTDLARIEEVIAAWSRAGVVAKPEPQPVADHPCWRKLTEDLAQVRVQVMDMERALERMHQADQPEVKPLPPRQGAPVHRVPSFEDGVAACAKALRRLELPFGMAVEQRAALSRHLLETVKWQDTPATDPAITKAQALDAARVYRAHAEEMEGRMDEADRQTLLAAAGHLEAAWA